MPERSSIQGKWTPRLLSVLRIVAGFLYLWHGTQKLLGYPPMPDGGGGSLPPMFVVAGWLELVGGVLLMLGVFTRPVAFVLAGEMAVAYFIAHAPVAPLPLQNAGELAVLYCFLFLFLAFAGGGPWSLDRLIWRRRGDF